MTFFDKLFTSRNKIFKPDLNSGIYSTNQSDVCTQFELAAEQVRVLVFRECERRGRKLLFDSDTVEQVAAESVCRIQRPSEVVEVNSVYAYKYKKACAEVTALGEMVFGSVAVCFKGGAVCKIHNIPSPKRLLFTTIVPTSVRCHNPPGSRRVSDCAGSSSDSKTSGCSSDSKLYHCSKKTANNCPGLLSPCQRSKKTCTTPMGLHRSPNSASLTGLGADVPDGCEERLTSLCSFAAEQPSLCSRLFPELSMTGDDNMPQLSSSPFCSRRPSDGRSCTGGSFDSGQSLYESYGSHCDSRSSSVSRNCSGGSLSSLRRRWHHSMGTSLEASFCEGEDSSVRVRTKLGIALAVSLPEYQQTDLECYLLNNSHAMERILDRLRSLIEDSYSRYDEFVHLTYTAFLTTRASVVDLVKSRQYLCPRWLSTATERAKAECQAVRSGAKAKKSICGKGKFVAEFGDVLRLFESKETNFFVSTLLTAVLTHNLSWVQSNVDKSSSQDDNHDSVNEKTPYSPLSDQFGDLCGILGFPPKATKIVVSGSESERQALSSLLNILTYFIRCNNVVENTYEADFSSITAIHEKTQDENFDSGVDCEMREAVAAVVREPVVTRQFDALLKSSCADMRQKVANGITKTDHLYPNLEEFLKIDDGLRTECETNLVVNKPVPVKAVNSSNTSIVSETPVNCAGFVQRLSEDECSSRNFVSILRKSEPTRDCCNSLQSTCLNSESSLYPNIEELARLENVRLEDLSSVRDSTMFVDCLLKKNGAVEMSASPDEGYDTLHAGSAFEKEKNVLFVVGESKAPVTVVAKASSISVEAEESQSNRSKKLERPHTVNIPVLLATKILQQRSQTMENISQECQSDDLAVDLAENEVNQLKEEDCINQFQELFLSPCSAQTSCHPLLVCSMFGEVSCSFSPYQVLQAVTLPSDVLEQEIRKDLSQSVSMKIHDAELSEAVCVVGDLRSWSVTLHSTKKTTMGPKKGISVASSQMVADMLESFSHLRSLGVSPDFCLHHLEKKLREIYTKSKAVAELLMTTDFCNLDFLTSCLDIAVNDVPLLMSVATAHTPELAERYGVTFS